MSGVVLIVGASGWLGGQIAERTIARGLPVRVGLRHGSDNAKAAAFDGRAEVVSADLGDPASLAAAVQGVETIVSVVQGGPAEIIDGQVALARAGLEAGVRRILPSDYSIEYRGLSEGRHLFLGWRAEADRRIAELGLPQTNILNGTFIEILGEPFFGMVDVEGAQIHFYGDADQRYEFTATPDVAEFAAEVIRDPRRLGPQMVMTERVSPRQLGDIASAAFGRPFALDHLGGVAALEAELRSRQEADPEDPMAWIGLQYQRLMATGEATLALPVSSSSITAHPVTIRQFLAGSGDDGPGALSSGRPGG